MPALDNQKHERFAQLVAKGATQAEAARTVGFSEKSARFQGSRLANDVNVVARIRELTTRVTDQAMTSSGIDRAWVIGKLVQNVERSMQAEPVYDNEGKPTGEYRYEGTVANQALGLIGKEIGMFSGQPNEQKAEKAAIPQWLQHQLSEAGSTTRSPLNADFTVISATDTKAIPVRSDQENHTRSSTKPSSYVT